MKITELKDKILIAELDPEKDYICLVNPAFVSLNTLKVARSKNKTLREYPVVFTSDITKAIGFIEIPKTSRTVEKVIDIAEKLAGKEQK